MKTFAQIVEETSGFEEDTKKKVAEDSLDEGKLSMEDWVFDKLENTIMDIDQLRAAFKKKFGSSKMKDLEGIIDQWMDEN